MRAEVGEQQEALREILRENAGRVQPRAREQRRRRARRAGSPRVRAARPSRSRCAGPPRKRRHGKAHGNSAGSSRRRRRARARTGDTGSRPESQRSRTARRCIGGHDARPAIAASCGRRLSAAFGSERFPAGASCSRRGRRGRIDRFAALLSPSGLCDCSSQKSASPSRRDATRPHTRRAGGDAPVCARAARRIERKGRACSSSARSARRRAGAAAICRHS